MSLINDRLKQLNIVLPPAPAPAANYVPYVKSNKLIFVSGQIPMLNGELVTGKIGKNIEIEDAKTAARLCGLAIVSQLNEATDLDLDKIKRIVKLGGAHELASIENNSKLELWGTRQPEPREPREPAKWWQEVRLGPPSPSAKCHFNCLICLS